MYSTIMHYEFSLKCLIILSEAIFFMKKIYLLLESIYFAIIL